MSATFKTIECEHGTRVLCATCGYELTVIALRGVDMNGAGYAMIEECMRGVLMHNLYTQHKGDCFGEPCEGRR